LLLLRTVFSYVYRISPFFCFFRHSFFLCFLPPASSFSFVPRAGVDIGSICDLPRATITCNTVGLSGPMGTRWGVLSVRKKGYYCNPHRVRRRSLTKGTICRPCLIIVDGSDDLSETSLQLDIAHALSIMRTTHLYN